MDGAPQRWWQWLLMYPTIALAVAGAVPQYYQWINAAAIGLPIFGGDVGDAQQQEKTWERNVTCLRSIDHIKPTSSTNYSIDLVSCPTGDILVTLTPLQNPDQQVSRSIITKVLFTQVADAAPPRVELAQAAGAPRRVRIPNACWISRSKGRMWCGGCSGRTTPVSTKPSMPTRADGWTRSRPPARSFENRGKGFTLAAPATTAAMRLMVHCSAASPRLAAGRGTARGET